MSRKLFMGCDDKNLAGLIVMKVTILIIYNASK